jgi:Isochorismate synthase
MILAKFHTQILGPEPCALFSREDGSVILATHPIKKSDQPHPEKFSLYQNDFLLTDEKPWTIFDKVTVLNDTPSYEDSLNISWSKPDKNVFHQQFLSLQNLIQQHQLQKGVLFTTIEAQAPRKQILSHTLNSLIQRKNKENRTLWGVWSGNHGAFGASPECILSIHNNLIRAEAVAGTANNSQTLETSKKLQQEHHLVVEGILASTQHLKKGVVGPCQIKNLEIYFTESLLLAGNLNLNLK